MSRYLVVAAVFWLHFFGYGPLRADAEEQKLEILTESKAKLVWQRLVEATQNLDTLSHAKLIVDVPAVPSGNGISNLAAGFASIALFREDSFFAPDASLMQVSWKMQKILKKQLPNMSESKRFMVADRIQRELRKEYYQDLVRNQRKPPKVSKPEVFVRTIQEYFDHAKNSDTIKRLKEAIGAFLEIRDLTVDIAAEDASWDRCQEAVIRNLPFLCLGGDHDNPQVFVCVGYAEGNNRKYLAVLNPETSQLQNRPLAGMMTDLDRAMGGKCEVVIRSLGGTAIHTDFYKTQPSPAPIPGLAFLAFRSSAVRCVFIHNWKQDETAVQKRIERLLADSNPGKK